MSPERRDPTDPREWLRRARSNLIRARAPRPGPEVLYEDLCFDAQQAAEKAVIQLAECVVSWAESIVGQG